VSSTEVKGFIRQKNGYVPHYTVYFVVQLSKPIESADAWQAEPYSGTVTNYGTGWRQKRPVQKNVKTFDGKAESGVILNFTTASNKTVIVRSGISFVSMDQAGKNLATEMSDYGHDFDKVAAANKAAWNKQLVLTFPLPV